MRFIQDEPLTTLAGAGGIGKTRLAVEAASQTGSAFEDGAWFADLSAVSESGSVANLVAKALAELGVDGRRTARGLSQALRKRRLLLILDNCEHVIEQCAELADQVLEYCPAVHILATSREPLDLPTERLWTVGPLAAPAPGDSIAPGSALKFPAVQLFVDRAKAADPGFELNSQTAPVVVEICRRLDGIPLALQLAAGRVKSLSVEEILVRLAENNGFVSRPNRSRVVRHRDLSSAVEWGYRLLSPAEQALVRRLSVFPAGFAADAARQICSGRSVRAEQVPDLLEQLQTKSWLTAEKSSSQTRFRMLTTIRTFCGAKLASSETTALRTALVAWCAELAEKAEPALGASDQVPWLDRLDAEYPTLSFALEAGPYPARGQAVLRLAGALGDYWNIRGRFDEGRRYLEGALAGNEEGDAVPRAKAIWALGLVSGELGATEAAVATAEKSLQIYRDLGDQAGRSRALSLLGHLCLNQHPRRALSLAEEAVGLARKSANNRCLAEGLEVSGHAGMMLGDTEAALNAFEECLELGSRLGERRSAAAGAIGLGWIHLVRAEWSLASSRLTEGLALARELGDRPAACAAMIFLSDMMASRGDFASAAEYLDECLSFAREAGSQVLTARTLGAFARQAGQQGRLAQASGYFDEANDVARKAGLSFVLIRNLQGRAAICVNLGDERGARALLQEALEVARRIGDKQGLARSLSELAEIDLRRGDDERATALHHEALELFNETAYVPGIFSTLKLLGDLAQQQNRLNVAVRLFAAADALKHSSQPSSPPGPVGCSCLSPDIAALRERMGEGDFEAAWRQGAGMSHDEAIAYALRRRRTREDRPTSGWASLTRAERKVVECLKEGLTNAEIAERLYIAPKTVGSHIEHIFAKLGMNSRKEVARRAAMRD